jgi:hypothetical protein
MSGTVVPRAVPRVTRDCPTVPLPRGWDSGTLATDRFDPFGLPPIAAPVPGRRCAVVGHALGVDRTGRSLAVVRKPVGRRRPARRLVAGGAAARRAAPPHPLLNRAGPRRARPIRRGSPEAAARARREAGRHLVRHAASAIPPATLDDPDDDADLLGCASGYLLDLAPSNNRSLGPHPRPRGETLLRPGARVSRGGRVGPRFYLPRDHHARR